MKPASLLAACVLALLVACTSAPPRTVVTVQTPPDSLLRDCPHASRPADRTVYGLAMGLIDERAVLEACDWADKAALRAWKMGVTAGQEKPAGNVKGND